MKTALRNTTWTQRLLAALFLIGGYAAGGWILLAVSAVVIALLVKPLGPAWKPNTGGEDIVFDESESDDLLHDLKYSAVPGNIFYYDDQSMFDE